MMSVWSIRLICVAIPTGKSPSVSTKRVAGSCDGFMNCHVAQSYFVAIVWCIDSDSIILFPIFFFFTTPGYTMHVLSSKPHVRGRSFIVPKKQVAQKMNCPVWLHVDPQYVAEHHLSRFLTCQEQRWHKSALWQLELYEHFNERMSILLSLRNSDTCNSMLMARRLVQLASQCLSEEKNKSHHCFEHKRWLLPGFLRVQMIQSWQIFHVVEGCTAMQRDLDRLEK